MYSFSEESVALEAYSLNLETVLEDLAAVVKKDCEEEAEAAAEAVA